jgi:TolB protein
MATLIALAAIAATAQPVTAQESWEDHRPVVSPDGRNLAFMSNRSGTWSVYVMPLDGSAPARRVSDDARGEWYADWSPDGSSLVYHRSDGAGAVFLRGLDLATGREYALGPTDGDRAGARWAPDGSAIFYRCNGVGVCRMTPDGKEIGIAFGLDSGQGDPAVSPDGRWIAYTDPLDGSEDAFIMRTDGSDRRRITDDPGRTYGMDWSPDGRFLGYNTEVDGNAELFVFVVATGERRRLTTDPGEDHLPRWSPHGTYLVFTSDRSGRERIYRIAPDGTGLTRVETAGR